MIIQIRGTSGSGKSTAMRFLIALLGTEEAIYSPGRKAPMAYWYPGYKTMVMGHYQTACGGCDTIGSARETYDETVNLLKTYKPAFIVQEGLLLSEDVKWTTEMVKTLGQEVHCYWLMTPIETCWEYIGRRREKMGESPELTEKTKKKALDRAGTIDRARGRLAIACGWADPQEYIHRCSANQAPRLIYNRILRG